MNKAARDLVWEEGCQVLGAGTESQAGNTQQRDKDMSEGCPVNMFNLQRCGRPLYSGSAHHRSPSPVCIMHSHDPAKSRTLFFEEFERTLSSAGHGVANFAGFVFPKAALAKRSFLAKCIFNRVIFLDAADFFGAKFTNDAIFSEVIFLALAYFNGCAFSGQAVFAWSKFTKGADFRLCHFKRDAKFHETDFADSADFSGASFDEDAFFNSVVFQDDVRFNVIRPGISAHVVAPSTTPSTPARIPFIATTFNRVADFREATFKKRAEFRQVQFREDISGQPGPIFGMARFDDPRQVVFYDTYLGQALFLNSDVSGFDFTDVRWQERANRKKAVFEENPRLVPRDERTVALISRPGSADERNYALIAELYQQLKKNYDDRRDYWTAGDWHYGEMEMKRISSPHRNELLRWWHRNLGLVALYRLASEYGESYKRPFALLAITVLCFALLIYPNVGLRCSGAHSQSGGRVVKWWDACPDSTSYHTCMGLWRLAGNSLLTSVEVAAFQRDLAYEPTYPWGRLLRLLELMLTSTLLALFLLAVRRQFRR